MTAWRARRAVLRSEHADADADRAINADSLDGSPIGANGAFGIRIDALRRAAKAGADRSWRERVACLLRAADEAEAALPAPDPERDAERAVLPEHYAERDALPPQLEAYCSPAASL